MLLANLVEFNFSGEEGHPCLHSIFDYGVPAGKEDEMHLGHSIVQCSCGKIISQCRCWAKDKPVYTLMHGCPECQNKLAIGLPASLPPEKVSPGENQTQN